MFSYIVFRFAYIKYRQYLDLGVLNKLVNDFYMKRYVVSTIYILILGVVATLYYTFVFKDLERVIQSQIEHQFESDMQMKSLLIDNALSKHIQGTKSISSRTMIKDKIIEFKKGDISFHDLKTFTTSKYTDGVNALEDVIMAQRYVNYQIVVQVGDCEMTDIKFILKDAPKQQIKAGFLFKDRISIVYVVSPIVDGTEILGYDLICYDSKSIEKQNETFPIEFSLQDTNEIDCNVEVRYTSDKVTCIVKSEQIDAFFNFSVSKELLFSELDIFYTTQLFVFILILICIVLITYIIHRRAMLISIQKSEYMEMLVAEKTRELNTVNDELHNVNLIINDERKQFLSVLDTIPGLIYVSDFDTHRILFANEKMKEVIGRDVTGEVCCEAIQNKSDVCDFCTNNKIKDTFSPYFWERYNPAVDKYFSIMSRKIKWTDNKEVRFEIAVDISEQKKSEQIIRESEEKFRLITENASDVIWIFNVSKQKLTYISPALYQIHGYTSEEGLKLEIDQLVSSEFAQKAKERVAEIINQLKKNPEEIMRKSYNFEVLGRRKDKSQFWIEIKTSFNYNKNKEIELLGISRDIDKRIILKQKLQTIIDNSPIAIVTSHGVKQVIEYINPVFTNLFGYTIKDMPTFAHWWSLAYKDIAYKDQIEKEWNQRVKKAIETKSDIEPIETIVNCKDGSNKQIKWGYVSTGILNWAFGIDLTEQRIAEIELNMAKLKAEEDAHKLKELNATKDRFISILGHDLKSPFNSLLGFSEILMRSVETLDKDKIKKYVGFINNAAEQTFNLLNNILEWSINQQNKNAFHPTLENLYHLVYETYTLLNPLAIAKEIDIQINVSKQIDVMVDSEMIKTVIRNLLNNAIKFTPPNGSIQISVTTDNETVDIQISDTGVGMDQKIIDSLFKIDEFVSQKGTSGELGTGFGLLLIKDFVDKHQGSIIVKSEVGKGSIFIVKLPLSIDN